MTQTTTAFETEGIAEQMKKLDRLLMSNPDMEKKVRSIIRRTLAAVKKVLQDLAKSAITGRGGKDLRDAYKAVKYSVYRQILGGNVSLLNRKRAGRDRLIEPPRNPSNGRGGNRRPRSADTKRIQSYYGEDRAFILRWLNLGAGERNINFTVNPKRRKDKWNQNPNTGNRKSIAARNFFDGDVQMKRAADQISILIDELIKDEFGE